MSTDTYFDFHLQESRDIEQVCNAVWTYRGRGAHTFGSIERISPEAKAERNLAIEAMLAAVDKVRALIPDEVIERVGYVYNFTCPANTERWDTLTTEFQWAYLRDDTIDDIVAIWADMYRDRDMTGPAPEDCITPERVRELLVAHKGQHICFRVD